MRNEYNFLNNFWIKTDKDSVRYCRIRMWNWIEKINKNRIWMYSLYYHIKFEYGYGYLYWCLSGYGCQIIWIPAIRFPSLHESCCWREHGILMVGDCEGGSVAGRLGIRECCRLPLNRRTRRSNGCRSLSAGWRWA